MTKAPTPTEMSNRQSDNTNNATKISIKQRLQTNLKRSVEVTTAIQLVWLTWFTGPPSHSPQQPCNQKDTRRRGRNDEPCTNLRRDDKVLSFVHSDYYSALLQPLDLSSRVEYAKHSLLFEMSLDFLCIYYNQHLCIKFVFSIRLKLLLVLGLCMEVYLYLFLNICLFIAQLLQEVGRFGPLTLG